MVPVQEKFEIFELMHNYIMSIDDHDAAVFANNFTNDGIYESPWGIAQGRDAIINTIAYWHSSGITAGKRHYVGNIRIKELQATSAVVESTYWVAEAQENAGVVATGSYSDVLQKENGQWKIAQRKQTVDPSFKMNHQ
jgi:SnoaL-like domain